MRLSLEPSTDPGDYQFVHQVRTRFAETDAMGVIHHGAYAPYLEEARVAMLRHAGIGKDALLVGALTKFNLYAPSRWGKVEARTSGENFGDLMRRLGI